MKTRRRDIPRGEKESAYMKGDDHDLPMAMNFPGLCNGGNTLDNTYSRTEKATDGVLLKVRCDVELFNEAKEQPWYPKEPYATARPRSDTFSPTRQFSDRPVDKESFNYAKALLESDTELERLAQKISSQIRHSEMLELAVQAEKAADAGLETFRVDDIPADRHGSYKDGDSAANDTVDSGKINSLELRHISEVIPEFNHLNAHTRTHLFRHSVDERTLVFKEAGAPREGMQDQSRLKAGSDIAKQSINFFRSISRLRLMQKAGSDFIEEKKTEALSSTDDVTNQSMPSEPVGTSFSQLLRDSSRPASKEPAIDVSYESSKTDDAENDDTVTRQLSLNTRTVPIDKLSVEEPDLSKETLSLFDEDNEDNDNKSRPSSPLGEFHSPVGEFHSSISPTPPPELLLTPRIDDGFTWKGSDFLTPERLRNIRRNEKEMSTTPDAMKFNFSPSSIIDSAYGNGQESPQNHTKTILREQESRFLELPTIKDEMKQKDSSDTLMLRDEAAGTRSIQMPQRRLVGKVSNPESNTIHPRIPNISQKSPSSLDSIFGTSETPSVTSRDAENKDAQNIAHPNVQQATHYPLHQKPSEYRQDYSPFFPEGKTDEVQGSFPKPLDFQNEAEAAWKDSKAAEPCLEYISNNEQSTLVDHPTKSTKVQSTLEEIISKLSPRSNRGPMDCFKDSENNEFLSNYFYCAKPKDRKRVSGKREKHQYRYYCGETIGRQGMLCNGVDSVCHGLDFLFPKSNETGQNTRDPNSGGELGLSLDKSKSANLSSGWLGALTNNRFNFSFKNASGADGQMDANFRPPFLKRSGTEKHS
jgi:hypothetical protein